MMRSAKCCMAEGREEERHFSVACGRRYGDLQCQAPSASFVVNWVHHSETPPFARSLKSSVSCMSPQRSVTIRLTRLPISTMAVSYSFVSSDTTPKTPNMTVSVHSASRICSSMSLRRSVPKHSPFSKVVSLSSTERAPTVHRGTQSRKPSTLVTPDVIGYTTIS